MLTGWTALVTWTGGRGSPRWSASWSTLASLYAIYWFLLVLAWCQPRGTVGATRATVLAWLATLALGVAGTLAAPRRGPAASGDGGPLPGARSRCWWPSSRSLAPLSLLLPEDQRRRRPGRLSPPSPGALAGLLDTRVRNASSWCRAAACGPAAADPSRWPAYGSPSGVPGVHRAELAVADGGRQRRWTRPAQRGRAGGRPRAAALLAGRPRRDGSPAVTIAVQAELAATLAARGDGRATDQMLEMRAMAHEALREARELARGYRPLDLANELDGAARCSRRPASRSGRASARLPRAGTRPPAGSSARASPTCSAIPRQLVEIDVRPTGSSGLQRRCASGQLAAGDGSGLHGLRERLPPLGARRRASGDEGRWTVFVAPRRLRSAPSPRATS